MTLDARVYPVEILERVSLDGRPPLVRVNGMDGWIPETHMGPCGTCQGSRFALIERHYESGAVRRTLRCPRCAPADRRRNELFVAMLKVPAVDLTARAAS